MAIIMTLRIGNGAVHKSSSQWQLKECSKLNNSVHELFIFKILLIAKRAILHALCHIHQKPIKVQRAPNTKGVCLQNTSKSRSYHLKIW